MKSIIFFILLLISPYLLFGEQITHLEYFINSEPGIKQGNIIDINDNDEINVIDYIDASELSDGLNNVCFRVRNNLYQWSFTECITAYKTQINDDIIQIEYFFNDDSGQKSGTVYTLVSPDTTVEHEFQVPVVTLNTGINILGVRVRNARFTYGNNLARTFFISEDYSGLEIDQLEYFFVDDNGIEQNNLLSFDTPGNEVDQIFEIDMSSLNDGINTFAFRVGSNMNIWSNSFTNGSVFIDNEENPLNITKMEYFFDDEVNHGNGTEIITDENNSVTVSDSSDLTSLSKGIHKFTYRFMNEKGTWSNNYSSTFRIEDTDPNVQIVDAEWFYPDTYPDFGSGNQIQFQTIGYPSEFSDQASVEGYPSGDTNIVVRVKGDNGIWSIPVALNFTISGLEAPQLIYPANNAGNIAIIPTNTWDNVNGATNYDIQISTDFADFENKIIFDKNITSPQAIISEGSLQQGNTYYWRVMAHTADESTDWSQYFGFTTKTGLTVQQINLVPGWNFISSYIDNDVDDFRSIISGVSDDIDIIRDDNRNVVIQDFGINEIGTWQYDDAYRVYASDNATLNLYGDIVNTLAVGVQINSGWNYFPYIKNIQGDISTELQELIDNNILVMIRDNVGNIYIPALNINTIGNLEPGAGYFLYASSNYNFFYP